MNTALSLPPKEDIDTQMLKVAREIAMDIHDLPTILTNHDVSARDFHKWKDHPRFIAYLKSETEAWNSALNSHERAKLKASVIMEDYMVQAHKDLHDLKQPLNHRVTLAQTLAKIAGMGEAKIVGGGAGGGGFNLQINIGPGVTERIVIRQDAPVIDHDDYDPFAPIDTLED